MDPTITEVNPGFVARVTGLRLDEPLEPDAVAAIQAAIDRFAVLVFPDQPLDDAKQVAFSRNFGVLEHSMGLNRDDPAMPPEISDLSNVDGQGQRVGAEAPKVYKNLGNEFWHSDSSFKPIAAKYSLLSAREIPPEGGETEYADVRAGYETWPGIDGVAAADLDGLIVEHSIVYSRMVNTGDVFDEKEKADWPPVRQHLVRTHPATGRKCVLVGSHAARIVGWPEEKARRVIDDLNAWCTQPRFVHVHRWRQHDLMMWDNRSVLHRGRPFDRAQYRRVMHRTTVRGDGVPVPI